jgi:hypothetical protein
MAASAYAGSAARRPVRHAKASKESALEVQSSPAVLSRAGRVVPDGLGPGSSRRRRGVCSIVMSSVRARRDGSRGGYS